MKQLILNAACLVAIGLALSACGSSGSGSESKSTPGATPPVVSAPVLRHVTEYFGSGFACYVSGADLMCFGTNGNLGLNSSTPVAYVSGLQVVTGVLSLDNTVCVAGPTSLRPWAQSPGVATLCFGFSNANGANLAGQHALYAPGPQASDLAPELLLAQLPFMSVDADLAQTVSLNPFADSSGSSGSRTEDCILANGVLTCPDFSQAGVQ